MGRQASGLVFKTDIQPEYKSILSPEACSFLAFLHRSFNKTRLEILQNRAKAQDSINKAQFPSFLKETEHIRDDPHWIGAPLAPGLVDRRVEITGPVDRKMVINALNSGATQFMADFEDSNSPTWQNCMSGQLNLRDAIHRTIELSLPNGKHYKLNTKVATLLVRPRGWHMEEKHVYVDDEPLSASLFDFGLYFFHNAKKSLEVGQGPYFYLPKIEHYQEAKLWNDIFVSAQDYIGIPRATIRATVLIETMLAAFQMEEIIYQLREHSAGLNCGRWDYIFSMIKKFHQFPEFVLPDRQEVTMEAPFMDAYVKGLIYACHKRKVHAMGGMAAQIPIHNDSKANEISMNKVKADKLREVLAGHDGTWVAHPALIPLTKEIFDKHMPTANQIERLDQRYQLPSSKALLNVELQGTCITEHGVRNNISVTLQYIEAWLRGVGCVPIHNLMEDAATAEIARSQLWQWFYHSRYFQAANGQKILISKDILTSFIDEEFHKLTNSGTNLKTLSLAKAKLLKMVFSKSFIDFLTIDCYDLIIAPFSSKL